MWHTFSPLAVKPSKFTEHERVLAPQVVRPVKSATVRLEEVADPVLVWPSTENVHVAGQSLRTAADTPEIVQVGEDMVSALCAFARSTSVSERLYDVVPETDTERVISGASTSKFPLIGVSMPFIKYEPLIL